MAENKHIGHRARMRRKFREYGDRFFDDYELLEMLLYFSVPVRDTNPMAKDILSAFGGLGGVMSASAEELMQISGVGEKVAGIITETSSLLRCICTAEKKDEPIFCDYNLTGRYFAERIMDLASPAVYMATFDNRMNLICFDKMYELDYSSGGVKAQPFVSLAINRRASAVIIVHNHPNGPLFPTEGDRETNSVIACAMESAGIPLLEHYVTCGVGYIGFMNMTKVPLAQRNAAVLAFLNSKGKDTMMGR